mmetsp:Transcript_2583/g.7786  ORF Transcript_2583/g.7786 Transcript_2583/m.7786 type:complete len:285 (+) Transcript_2583:747-1601(+)
MERSRRSARAGERPGERHAERRAEQDGPKREGRGPGSAALACGRLAIPAVQFQPEPGGGWLGRVGLRAGRVPRWRLLAGWRRVHGPRRAHDVALGHSLARWHLRRPSGQREPLDGKRPRRYGFVLLRARELVSRLTRGTALRRGCRQRPRGDRGWRLGVAAAAAAEPPHAAARRLGLRPRVGGICRVAPRPALQDPGCPRVAGGVSPLVPRDRSLRPLRPGNRRAQHYPRGHNRDRVARFAPAGHDHELGHRGLHRDFREPRATRPALRADALFVGHDSRRRAL